MRLNQTGLEAHPEEGGILFICASLCGYENLLLEEMLANYRNFFEGINIFPNLVNTCFYFSDLDAFDDAKFSRLRDYISEHLSRDSCLLCLGNLICTDHIVASNLLFFLNYCRTCKMNMNSVP